MITIKQPYLVLRCDKGKLKHQHYDVPLPYRILPAEEDDLSDILPISFGCGECGCVREYTGADISWPETNMGIEGEYASAAKCCRVEFECLQQNCDAFVCFHVELGRDSEEAVRRKLTKGFYSGSCPKGHDFSPLPANYCFSVEKTFEKLWRTDGTESSFPLHVPTIKYRHPEPAAQDDIRRSGGAYRRSINLHEEVADEGVRVTACEGAGATSYG